ncbi:hypothetical protein H8356DRAFT_1420549 [Neocallimastix lanati (nom. inval.)]|nr:hypothetical protein H8356DRAFT_1420549 [Neocallimastix sp. JGI-2020a]
MNMLMLIVSGLLKMIIYSKCSIPFNKTTITKIILQLLGYMSKIKVVNTYSADANSKQTIIRQAYYNRSKKYPVFYSLHGIMGNEDSILNSNIDVNKMIIVLPNNYALPQDKEVEAVFTQKYFDSYDNFIKNTAICGFSMSGRDNLYIGLFKESEFCSQVPSIVTHISFPGAIDHKNKICILKSTLIIKAKAAIEKKVFINFVQTNFTKCKRKISESEVLLVNELDDSPNEKLKLWEDSYNLGMWSKNVGIEIENSYFTLSFIPAPFMIAKSQLSIVLSNKNKSKLQGNSSLKCLGSKFVSSEARLLMFITILGDFNYILNYFFNICKVDSVKTTKLSLELREILLGDSISIDSLGKERLLLFMLRCIRMTSNRGSSLPYQFDVDSLGCEGLTVYEALDPELFNRSSFKCLSHLKAKIPFRRKDENKLEYSNIDLQNNEIEQSYTSLFSKFRK